MSGGTGGNLGLKRRVGVAKCQMYSSFFLSSCRCVSVLRRKGDRRERRVQNVNAHFLLLLVSCAPNSTTITSPPPQAYTHKHTCTQRAATAVGQAPRKKRQV